MTTRLSAKQRWQIACQHKLLWASLMLAILTGVFFVNADTSDFWLRMWSLVLQLMGAYIVLRDLSGAVKDFGVSGIIENNKRWFNAVVLGRPTVVSATLTINAGIGAASGVGQVRVTLTPDASIEERLAHLQRYIETVDSATTQAFALINAKERALEEKIRKAHTELEQALAATNSRVKNAVVGNYSMLFFGAAWVAIGTILSTFAPEVPKLLTGNWGFTTLPFDNIDMLKFRHLVGLSLTSFQPAIG